MKRVMIGLVGVAAISVVLVSCKKERPESMVSTYDPVKAEQENALTHEEIRKGDPDGLLKLWVIATKSDSAEDREVASEEVRGYLYSNTDLWIKAFSRLDLEKFKKDFEVTDFDVYRFTSDGELPVEVVAQRVTVKLKKMKAKNEQECVLIEYLITYYGQYLKKNNNNN